MLHDMSRLLEQALTLWIDLLQIDENMTTGSSEQFKNRDQVRTIRETLVRDSSGVTALFLLKNSVSHYLANTAISLQQIINGDRDYLNTLSQVQSLLKLLDNEVLNEHGHQFMEAINLALLHYQLNGNKVLRTLVDDGHTIWKMRHEALYSVEKLNVFQFLSGEPEPAGVKPQYHKDIYDWWNINSLLSGSVGMPSGISLIIEILFVGGY